MTVVRVVVACLLLLSCAPPLADESNWTFENWDGPAFPVRMFVPGDVSPDSKIVVVMHGASRDAPRYFHDWQAMGEKLGLIIVVPEFSKRHFGEARRYNLGYIFNRGSTKQRAEKLWTFSAIEPLFDEVVARIDGKQKSYTIYGHSAGSQFVHRFMYYKPGARVDRYFAANAGWYTLPIDDFEYPYGLVGSGLEESDLVKIFAKRLIILLGRDDTDENDENLRKTPEANQQGPNRLARGLTMYRVSKARAEELGLEFNWQIFIIKDAGHVNAQMTPAAAAMAAQ
jgi:hypothetical protein